MLRSWPDIRKFHFRYGFAHSPKMAEPFENLRLDADEFFRRTCEPRAPELDPVHFFLALTHLLQTSHARFEKRLVAVRPAHKAAS